MKKVFLVSMLLLSFTLVGCSKDDPDTTSIPTTGDNLSEGTNEDVTNQELEDAKERIDALESRLKEIENLNKKVDDLSNQLKEKEEQSQAEEESTPTTNPTVTKTKSYYRVIAGSYADKTNADKMANALKEKNFDAYPTAYNKGYRVVAGTYGQKKNATIKQDMLKKAGYDSFITYE